MARARLGVINHAKKHIWWIVKLVVWWWGSADEFEDGVGVV
jgi:hypothetical protein